MVDQLGASRAGTLAELGADDRLLLWMINIDEVRTSEVGEVLGITDSAVRARLSRLRRKLRGRLADLWEQWDSR